MITAILLFFAPTLCFALVGEIASRALRFASEDRGYETDHIAWEMARIRSLPFAESARFLAVCDLCACSTRKMGETNATLAEVEIDHLLATGCRGALYRREDPTSHTPPLPRPDLKK